MICLTNHKDGAGILVEYLSRTLDAQRTAELDRHMVDCAECRRLVGVWNQLDELEAPEVSPDFDARLYARIAQESSAPWWKKMWSGEGVWWKAGVPAAACAALMVALLIGPSKVVSPDSNKAVLTGGADIEQVEQVLEDLELLSPAS
jgi:anti-sigma-K factor RskA